MNPDRISELLEPFLQTPLSAHQLDQVSAYIALLLRWNARINLTAIRKEEEIVTRHFGESLFLAQNLFPTKRHPERSGAIREADGPAESNDPYAINSPPPITGGAPGVPARPKRGAVRVLDIGSGAGFPGLPLKIWSPDIHLTLIESNHKKSAFLREAARALELQEVDVITNRAEDVAERSASAAEPGPKFEIVTLRAVENFVSILSTALSFMHSNSKLALLVGASQVPHLATLNSLTWIRPIPIPQSTSRVLSIGVLR